MWKPPKKPDFLFRSAEDIVRQGEKERRESFDRSAEFMARQREKEALEALQSAIHDYQTKYGDWGSRI